MPTPVDTQLATVFGAAAREARARLNLTQADVADKVGIAMEVYSRMERGKVLPRVQTLRRLCDVLQVSADALLGVGHGAGNGGGSTQAPRRPQGPGEDPAELRRITRTLRALEAPQLKAVSRVVRTMVSVLPRAGATPALAARSVRRRKAAGSR